MNDDWREEALLALRKATGEAQNGRLAKAHQLIKDMLDLDLSVYAAQDDDAVFATLDDEYRLLVTRSQYIYLQRRIGGCWLPDDEKLFKPADLGQALDVMQRCPKWLHLFLYWRRGIMVLIGVGLVLALVVFLQLHL